MGFALSTMQLTSPAFAAGGAIPRKHTGEGEDVSPALAFRDVPAGTQSLAVICHDPDAPLVTPGHYGFVHWVLYGIPASTRELAEGTTDFVAGTNDFGNEGYGGPMPPEGHGPHHYFFWVLALDAAPKLPAGLDLWTLLEKIEPHVLGMNRLVGTYRRG
ncbi:MAG: YbhB/YbcL family Raf kinase inhibitor-like protein [Spirochaetaceae bacterium]|nr:YbhB/YbcL family Raf kinase inhibitor-like protein [Myxococcales bacterium]MCB9725232.1 YbhB/YbcL family Raf kinase inhibitor-like protein [Spirochaetaceae bacterium]HPG25659.1 YbhB/YbcL family Raf kinase inhibitor-like protein [Myxococcota bacterium]